MLCSTLPSTLFVPSDDSDRRDYHYVQSISVHDQRYTLRFAYSVAGTETGPGRFALLLSSRHKSSVACKSRVLPKALVVHHDMLLATLPFYIDRTSYSLTAVECLQNVLIMSLVRVDGGGGSRVVPRLLASGRIQSCCVRGLQVCFFALPTCQRKF